MKPLPLLWLMVFLIILTCPGVAQTPPALRAQYDSAYFAWDKGEYIAALQHAERILVMADRDGNTLSPERGVYLVDLSRCVTGEEVLACVRRNLAAEQELRERGRRMFEPIATEVRAAVTEVDVGRIYDYAHALYQFGSKWFTEPGNRLAIDYLANQLRQMGYEPELQWYEPRPGQRTANVVATLRGTRNPEQIYVISSHFDSVEPSPGADDNSSGTTALLEAARVLANRPQPATIRFAFLTAEEAGLLGVHEFVRRARAGATASSGCSTTT